jgi:hypothetical protein
MFGTDTCTLDEVLAATAAAAAAAADDDGLMLRAGQGGCDLLGGKQQVRDQELKDANRHMLVNWALGIPVRYLRRNDDSDSTTGTSLIYDGLYYIVSVGTLRAHTRHGAHAAWGAGTREGGGADKPRETVEEGGMAQPVSLRLP